MSFDEPLSASLQSLTSSEDDELDSTDDEQEIATEPVHVRLEKKWISHWQIASESFQSCPTTFKTWIAIKQWVLDDQDETSYKWFPLIECRVASHHHFLYRDIQIGSSSYKGMRYRCFSFAKTKYVVDQIRPANYAETMYSAMMQVKDSSSSGLLAWWCGTHGLQQPTNIDWQCMPMLSSPIECALLKLQQTVRSDSNDWIPIWSDKGFDQKLQLYLNVNIQSAFHRMFFVVTTSTKSSAVRSSSYCLNFNEGIALYKPWRTQLSTFRYRHFHMAPRR
jgi:hypothetical protein